MGLRNERDGDDETMLFPSNFSSLLYCFSQIEDMVSNLNLELSRPNLDRDSLSHGGKVLLWHIFKTASRYRLAQRLQYTSFTGPDGGPEGGEYLQGSLGWAVGP